MQRINRNRMGPSFPKAPPARLPMMDFRAKPGFEQKYNILPDISGVRKEMDEDFQSYQHGEEFTHSWQSLEGSVGNPVHMGGNKGQKKNGHGVRMPLNREPAYLVDGFYNEPNDFNPGIQRTITQNHKILPRPHDPFLTTKNDAILNKARIDRTFITPNVDMSLYGTKNILPGISKKEVSGVKPTVKVESGCFMKRVQSSHALNVHLPRDKDPLMDIKPKVKIENSSDFNEYANEKQGRINIVPERFAEIMKEEIQYNTDLGHVDSTDVQPNGNEYEQPISGHHEKDSTDCTSFGNNDMAYSSYVDNSIKVDRREKLGIESDDVSNRSFSYEATQIEEDDDKEKIDYNVRREYCPEVNIFQEVTCINQEVKVEYEICDEEESAYAGDFDDTIQPQRRDELGVESSSEPIKSLSYEESDNVENLVEKRADYSSYNIMRRTHPDMETDRRDDIACINHEVEVGFETSDYQESACIVNKQERGETFGIGSPNESNKSFSYETTEVEDVDTKEKKKPAYVADIRQITCPEILTVRRDGMRCVNHEVDIEYEISDTEESYETESEDIKELDRAEELDEAVINDPKIQGKPTKLNSHNDIPKDYAIQNMDDENSKLTGLIGNRTEDDACKFDGREYGIENSNEPNQSSRNEASEIEDFDDGQEENESCDGDMIKPEVFTIRRDGMMCVNHEIEFEYETDEEGESYESESKSESKEFESHSSHHNAKINFDIPVDTFQTLDKDKYIKDYIVQKESSADLGDADCKKVDIVENKNPKNEKEYTATRTSRNEVDKEEEEHLSKLESIERGRKESVEVFDELELSPEKHYAARTKTQTTQKLESEKFENEPRIPLKIQDITPDAKSDTETDHDVRKCNRDLPTDCGNVVHNDIMKCVAYEVEPESGEECTESESKNVSGMGENDDKVSAYQSTYITSLDQPSNCSTIASGKESKESVEINLSHKDHEPTRDVKVDVNESIISRIIESISEKNKASSLHDKGKVKENSVKDTVNITNSEKSSKDCNTTISQKSSKIVIAVEPETVKRGRRKRKWERDKISQSATKTGGQREHVKNSTSPTDSNLKGIESNIGQITYETDDDIDNISDKILDHSSECYDENMNKRSIGQLQIKSVKRVTFDDEPQVYNIKSTSSSTGSNSTANRNDEDSTDHDTVYDTDEDIVDISNDILDEFDDEKQDISTPSFADKTFESIGDKAISVGHNVPGQCTNKGNNLKTSHDLPGLSTDLINLSNVSKDNMTKECKDDRFMKVADDMKLTMGQSIFEKKRCHSFDLRNTKRKVNDRQEKERKAVRVTLSSQKPESDNYEEVQSYNCDNLDNYEDIRGAAVIEKSIVAAGDSDIVSTLRATTKSKEKGSDMKLLTISRNAEENCTKHLIRTTTFQTKKAENGDIRPSNDLFDHYASRAHRSDLYKRIMWILETKVGRERAATLMRSSTITDMVENMSKNPEKYGKHYADLLKLREERAYLDLTQFINDPSKEENVNRSWCCYERLKVFALSSYSNNEHDIDDCLNSAMIQSNDEMQTDVNRNADKTDTVKDETKDTKGASKTRRRRRLSFKSFLRKFICVCKSKVDHEDI